MSQTVSATSCDAARLKADFPILQSTTPSGRRLVYLDSAASSQRPRQVIQALVETYEQHYANVHRGIHWLSDQATDRYELARVKVQALIGAADPVEVIFTHGTTEGINLVAHSWGDQQVGAGDEILLSEMEHHSNLVPWRQLAARRGAHLRYIPLTDEGTLDLEAAGRLLGDKTRLVAVTAVSNVLGTINPVRRLAELAHAAGALLLVDAAQSAPHEVIDVSAWDCDFLAFSGHKMLGPTGVGVLWGRREILEAMPPFLGGGSMIRRVQLEGFEPAELPAKFEAGTPPIVSAIGLGAAIDYLNAVGLANIARHEQLLTQRAFERLAAIEGLKILGPPPERRSGIVSFTIDSVHAHDVAQLLDREGIAVRAGHHCAMPLHRRLGAAATTRASFYLYNTLEDVDCLAEGLEKVRRVFQRR